MDDHYLRFFFHSIFYNSLILSKSFGNGKGMDLMLKGMGNSWEDKKSLGTHSVSLEAFCIGYSVLGEASEFRWQECHSQTA